MGRGLGWEGRCVVIGEGGIVRMRVSPGSSSSRKLGSCKHVPGRVCWNGVWIRDVASLLGNQGSGGLVVDSRDTISLGTQAPLSVLMGRGSKQCHLEVLAKATRMKC